jgi:hypothetical protein
MTRNQTTCREGSAWDTWRKAGAAYAIQCLERKISVVRLGEVAHHYAASRGFGEIGQDAARRAFIEGYWDELNEAERN